MIQHATRSLGMVFVILLSTTYLTGCGYPFFQSPVTGLWYTDVKGPVTATDNTINDGYVSGSSSFKSILGLIVTGDASIETAAKNAGITKIYYVDYSYKNVLGVVATYTVTVYGERGRPVPIKSKSTKKEKRKRAYIDETPQHSR